MVHNKKELFRKQVWCDNLTNRISNMITLKIRTDVNSNKRTDVNVCN